MDAETTPIPQDDTRDKLLAAAGRQFADRGFYGASIAQIAGEVGLTKQALLYHFKRKEDLYGEVLKGIAARLLAALQMNRDPSKPAAAQFEDMILGLYANRRDNPLDTKILMRELLDDQRRDAPESEWFLKMFLEEIVSVLDDVPGQAELPHTEKFARIYILLSASEYFVASEASLRRFYGDEKYREMQAAYPAELSGMVRRMLAGNS